MVLSNYIRGRDNNFNLIRMIAATAVLVTHSFVLSIGTLDSEPFRVSFKMTLGSLAVDMFFVTSGFLVTGSLLRGGGLVEFFWGRFLRIFPALWVMLLIVVFGVGAMFSSLPVSEYLSCSAVYVYLVKCATLVTGIAYGLPGVFSNNPYKSAVNGSLWTVPYELYMYISLAAIWSCLRLVGKGKVKKFKAALLIGSLILGFGTIAHHFFLPHHGPSPIVKLYFMFFSGATFYILKERIVMSRSVAWFLLASLVVSSGLNLNLFYVLYVLFLPYILFYVAFVPTGRIRKFNQFGDYSYGVYIYAFPVQQSVAAMFPGISVENLFLLSFSVTLGISVISWHFLESRFLMAKRQCVEITEKMLSRIILKSKCQSFGVH